MEQTTFKQSGGKATRYSLVALAAVVAGLVSLFFYSDKTTGAFLAVKDLPEAASVEATLEAGKSVTALAVEKDSVVLPEALKKTLAAPYRVNAAVKLPLDKYRDFSFTVTADRISVVTDGFQAGDLVSFEINQESAFERVPADWSGKLELIAALPKDKNIEACVYVAGKSETFGLCHTLAERRAL